MTGETIFFETREQFRAWLSVNASYSSGAWLEFKKKKGAQKLTAANALEEALCFGWIDGQLESLGEDSYRKYFAPRGKASKWSEKNRKIAEKLIAEGKMTELGIQKIEDAKKRSCYGGEERQPVSDEIIENLRKALADEPEALNNYDDMPKSARRAYAGDFNSAKTDAGRQKKLIRIAERLKLNLNPMESAAKKRPETDS